MQRSILTISSAILAVCLLAGAKPTHKLDVDKGLPKGLSPKITAQLESATHRISNEKGMACEIWFVKSPAVKPKFKPSLNVKYPFSPGQLLGAIRVGKAGKFTDFRGQESKPGVYTLRYGKQPEDGNHIGTSDLADFLLALPGKMDTDPKPLKSLETLHKRSAKSAHSTHPAIFSLLPAKATAKSTLSHNKDKELWILQVVLNRAAKDKTKRVPLKMVAVGKSEE